MCVSWAIVNVCCNSTGMHLLVSLHLMMTVMVTVFYFSDQVHGFPKVMGVLTHLDTFHSAKTIRKTKKTLKQRFWTEIYQVTVSGVHRCLFCI